MIVTRLAERAATTPGRVIALVGVSMLAAYLVAILSFPKPDGRVVFGDAAHHFVQLRSIVFDRDLHFGNDYLALYNLRGGELGAEWMTEELTSTGHVRNYMPVGPALLWAPIYLLLAAVQLMLSWMGITTAPDGFDRTLQLAPGISGVLATTVGAWLSFMMAKRYVDRTSALIGTIAVWVGSHAIYYAMVSPSYSHAASMFAASAFAFVWLAPVRTASLGRSVALGALAGVTALMRWQDAILLLIPFFEIIRARLPWIARLRFLAATGASWLVVFSPQMIVWQALYGAPFALPQGPSFLQWTSPHPFAVLFSDNHGLFTWAPILLLSVVGLIRFFARHRDVAWPFVLVAALSWYVNAAVIDWWGGEAFGARRFLSFFPFFALGLSVWISGRLKTPAPSASRLWIAAVFIGLNMLLLLQYQLYLKGLRTIAPYPDDWFDMFAVRFLVPVRLIGWWLS